MNILLISCDIFWDFEYKEKYFDKIIFGEPSELTFDQQRLVTHWIVNPAPNYVINKNTIGDMHSLKFIGSPSTGTTHIDLEKNQYVIKCLRDIPKRNLDKITASSEYTFFLFLALVRRAKNILLTDLNQWRNSLSSFRGKQISGMNIGILGVGRIGANLCRYLQAFGANVVYYDPNQNLDGSSKKLSLDIFKQNIKNLDALFVCFHASTENFQFVGSEFLSKMKKDSYFVNTSRGENIDEKYLAQLVRKKHFAGVGLDVLSDEQKGNFSERELVKSMRMHPNAILSPHIAGSSVDSELIAFNEILTLAEQL